jgi:transcriptional regulator with XRE-family HTH domain
VGQIAGPTLSDATIVAPPHRHYHDGEGRGAITTLWRYHRSMKAHVLTDAAPMPHRFRLFLQEELARRCARNPRYSLRAFARYLTLDHSTLSQLLRGRRRFTARTIERIGKRLSLSPVMITQFVERERAPAESWTSRELRQLSRDAALSLAEWHHHAILELTRLASFKPDVRWISRVLDVPVDQVNVAITRLTRLRLLDMRSPTMWVDAAGNAEARLDTLSLSAISALANRARTLLGASGSQPAHYSTTTVAVPAAASRRIAERVEQFRRDVAELLERDSSERDQVYCLELAFFPVADLTTTES